MADFTIIKGNTRASAVKLDTKNFNKNLSSQDYDVQHALETLDNLSTGGGTATLAAEVPSGAINGINTDYILSQTPGNSQAVIMVLDGVTQYNGVDFSVSGTTVSFGVAPVTGSTIFAYYAVQGTPGAGAFTDLTDAPNSYSGAGLKVVRVNASETGLEFATGGVSTVNSYFPSGW